MIKSTIRNSNFWLGLCVVLLIFVALYPTVELNTDCPMVATDPDGNESCIWIKDLLWNAVVLISLGLPGDGSSLSESIDEQHHRNMVPILCVIVIIMFYQKRKD